MRIPIGRAHLAVAAVLAVVAFVSLGSASAASGRSAIPNTKPTWLGHAKSLGQASPSAAVHARVYLEPRGGLAALARAAVAVSTPGSTQYGRFLTPSRYFQRFGTTAGTVGAVSSWLRGAGLRIASVEQHNRY